MLSRLQTDGSHTLELVALFGYRLAEVAARLTLLALFAVRARSLRLQPLCCRVEASLHLGNAEVATIEWM